MDRLNALVIDTAGPVVGVARLGRSLRTARVARGADQVLGPWLVEACAPPPALVAVSTGPGAFTGVRVGLAHALGLAVALELPVVALSSLAVRALLAPGEARVLVALDAKKGRVYAGLFDTRGPLPRLLGPEADLPPEALRGPGVAVGEGALVHAPLLERAGFRVLAGAEALPLDRVGPMLEAADLLDPAAVAPRYLRAADAHQPT